MVTTIYRTRDGREFDSKTQAENHEKLHANRTSLSTKLRMILMKGDRGPEEVVEIVGTILNHSVEIYTVFRNVLVDEDDEE